mmetsp:Transcript_80759/g.233555  ORF Transcript_80759/g.233555 Transcript_80759/m.233555 type:complete len:338 (-) Transcript_80759:59-1072(-)|eukprot:CAMPEP_0170251102 /NCGR_PEP_ID=MMETSP0116_2-20130129/25380_1 /TAXON_ID=400756 /ORGANISM="Durinskia baltica, Strain CSIRO CS-38" /LENGTH=337 /DNA_ID=CAMNT_0010502063 /DNA_START=80 /DNA_END=1093 /DNA_ORIENTATION=+
MIDFGFYLSFSGFLCSIAVICPSFIGWYLFRAGVADYAKGCQEVRNFYDYVLEQLEVLVVVIPICSVLRVFFAPGLWYHLADNGDFFGAITSLPAILWVLSWSVPFVMFMGICLKPGVRSVLSSDATINEWPEEMYVERPYHGLLSTRCHAMHGAFWIELLWNCWIIYCGADLGARVGGISIAIVVFNLGMVLGGPINFLARGPRCDAWIAQAYILVSVVVVEGVVALNHVWFGLKASIDHQTNFSPLGPYGHWAVIVWIGLLSVQTVTCRVVISMGIELRAGHPWECGGADHKEFYYPRFWGLIYVCYGMLFSFNCWIIGIWCSPAPAVIVPAQAY